MLLGIVFYTLAQGAQYVALAYLPAVVVNLVLNLSPVAVGMMAFFLSHEPPTRLQWAGILLAAIGTCIYFLPLTLPTAALFGLAAALVGVLANSSAALQGRQIMRERDLPPLIVTFISMGIGSALMLFIGLAFQGAGHPTLLDWGIVGWLAVVNTAFAFTLWNSTMSTLSAVESSILNSLMMPQIAIMAVVFLGEKLSGKDILGLVLVFIGITIVQLRLHRQKSTEQNLAA